MTGEEIALSLLVLMWSTVIGLPFLGLKVSKQRQPLFQKITSTFLKSTLFFTLGSFVFLLGETSWTQVFAYLMEGNMWVLCVAAPIVLWTLAAYFFYRIWRDLLYGLKEEQNEST